jgi:hypothetical protein
MTWIRSPSISHFAFDQVDSPSTSFADQYVMDPTANALASTPTPDIDGNLISGGEFPDIILDNDHSMSDHQPSVIPYSIQFIAPQQGAHHQPSAMPHSMHSNAPQGAHRQPSAHTLAQPQANGWIQPKMPPSFTRKRD